MPTTFKGGKLLEEQDRVSLLHERGAEAERCPTATLVWSLKRTFRFSSGSESTGGPIHRYDARTGELYSTFSHAVVPGRPFERRLPAVIGDASSTKAWRWVERARGEHASIASFARHMLEMMALGAPMSLLSRIIRAQGQEVEHARIALERARELGATVELTTLDTATPARRSTVEVALAVAVEGCVNETASTLELIDEMSACDDRDLEILNRLIRDEAEHAALAWETLRWLWPRLLRREKRRVRTAMAAAIPDHALDVLAPCMVPFAVNLG